MRKNAHLRDTPPDEDPAMRERHDPFAAQFRAACARVDALSAEQRARMQADRPLYDLYHDRLRILSPEAVARHHPDAADAVRRIEAGVYAIVQARDALPGLRDAALLAKAAALGKDGRGGDMARRAEEDFTELRRWRKAELDGVDCDLLGLLERRWPLATGRRAALFERLFASWARSAGFDPALAGIAVMAARLDGPGDDHEGFPLRPSVEEAVACWAKAANMDPNLALGAVRGHSRDDGPDAASPLSPR